MGEFYDPNLEMIHILKVCPFLLAKMQPYLTARESVGTGRKEQIIDTVCKFLLQVRINPLFFFVRVWII